jgi:cytochrome b6-f complex iron-sulfur subunit
MAQRPSVKEILELARKGGPARPAAEAEAPPASAEPEAEEAALEVEASTAPAPSMPAPSAPLGRPLTLKEKLAAARAGGAPAASATNAPAVAAEGGETEKAVPAPAASLGRPMTLQEKLAAARGAASAGGAAKPAASGAAKPASAKPAAAKAPARELPPLDKITDPKDLAEALRQAGAKQDKAVTAAKGEAAAKAAPAKPAAKGKAEAKTVPGRPSRDAALAQPTRRQLFGVGFWIAAGWTSFTLGMAAFTAMLGRFMFPNVLAEPPSTVKVGVPGDYAREDVSERFKAEWGFWIVRTERYNGQDIIFALKSICTHLGCPPNWLAGEQKFKCPCHGSGFYISGVNFEGPAPRPLERFGVSVADDGQILVDKAKLFQEELAQWSDPDSFLSAV